MNLPKNVNVMDIDFLGLRLIFDALKLHLPKEA